MITIVINKINRHYYHYHYHSNDDDDGDNDNNNNRVRQFLGHAPCSYGIG